MKLFSSHKARKTAVLSLCDVVSFLVAALLTHLLFLENASYGSAFPRGAGILWLAVNAVLVAVLFVGFGLYSISLKNAGVHELIRIGLALELWLALNAMYYLGSTVISTPPVRFMALVLFIGIFSHLALLSRFSIRIFRVLQYRVAAKGEYTRVMVVGGGNAGALIIREMQSSDKVTYLPVCVIDDDPAKQHTLLSGVPVVGTRKDIADMAERYNVTHIFVAMPSVSGAEIKEIVELCAATHRRVQILPGVYQLLDGTVAMSQMRDVSINDLLGRDPIAVNNEEVFEFIRGRTVLVTGGGGSIGSELCRQIAAHKPGRLVIFDIYENNAYEIEQELRRRYPTLDLHVLIGSVRDVKRVNAVFEAERPQVVFHAAAHKHVPLMETSPNEAIKNNVFGTYNVANAADKYGVARFVLISTDKAVNPTNVMGASKRICEMVVQDFARKSKNTSFVAVRFGNVLGSNGSVIPLFKKQIAEGGPVTVTHKEITRYFMTIPEAVALVLQAGAFAKGGEIFVLDMGKPVKIVNLAENLIRLSGFKPYEEIDIQFTGLRPGEKLYEELLMDEEGLRSTANKMIYIGQPIKTEEEVFRATLDELHVHMEDDSFDIRPLICRLVPTYHYGVTPAGDGEGEKTEKKEEALPV